MKMAALPSPQKCWVAQIILKLAIETGEDKKKFHFVEKLPELKEGELPE